MKRKGSSARQWKTWDLQEKLFILRQERQNINDASLFFSFAFALIEFDAGTFLWDLLSFMKCPSLSLSHKIGRTHICLWASCITTGIQVHKKKNWEMRGSKAASSVSSSHSFHCLFQASFTKIRVKKTFFETINNFRENTFSVSSRVFDVPRLSCHSLSVYLSFHHK